MLLNVPLKIFIRESETRGREKDGEKKGYLVAKRWRFSSFVMSNPFSTDERYYSLVLGYAEGGTLGKYLRDDTISFKWENQLKFAKEIASAISWLHDDVGIIHGDLHPNNILINKGSIKLADFGCSCLKGSSGYTRVKGVIPYTDPNFFEQSLQLSETQRHSYTLTEKADIYSLGVIFWELTTQNILKDMREKPSLDTDHKFIALYEKCWQHDPHERPEIDQIISELNNIEPLVVSYDFSSDTTKKSESEEVNVPSYDCDINKYNL
ncbi:kinase-like protein [Rhizophagus irregularis]|uniref:Kinase-like protein n=1 Tax=Rhizophagus irregularis TaxID=588596 RepID=A0A2I1GKT6_9GLOM|nr:kinase-like protein [Rhizophagus irregularis]